MCGIAGIISRSFDQMANLNSMLDVMKVRGPDGVGHWNQSGDWNTFLGHRRLAIIDIADGAQPMVSENTIITFNGEIFNFQDIREKYVSRGVTFKTRSDTEVLLKHVVLAGVGGIKDLNGMFAFGVWDQKKNRLVLARDRSGIKPLYYAHLDDGGVIFASDLRAILKNPQVDKSISSQSIASFFLTDYVPFSHTIMNSIKKLEPGHFVVWENGKIESPVKFWGVTESRKRQNIHIATSKDIWMALDKSVGRQMVSDVPVGVFLSGGLDSSIVAYLAKKRTENLKSFSIAFDEESFDESYYSRLVAKFIGTEHFEKVLRADEALDFLDGALGALDEPMGDPSLLPTYVLAHLASKHVKVALSGDGSDELWGGYPTYRAHKYAGWLASFPDSFINRAASFMNLMKVSESHQSLEWKIKRFIQRWDRSPLKRHLRWMSGLDLTDLNCAIGWEGVLPVLARIQALEESFPVNEILDWDFETYLPSSVLAKVDRATMAFGLEARPPFLDNEMIDFALSQPARKNLSLGGKAALKYAAAPYLPQEVIYRRKKGFGIPLIKWVKGPLRYRFEQIFHESPVWGSSQGKEAVLRRSIFRDYFDEHLRGERDYSKPLWSLLVLHQWMKNENLSL